MIKPDSNILAHSWPCGMQYFLEFILSYMKVSTIFLANLHHSRPKYTAIDNKAIILIATPKRAQLSTTPIIFHSLHRNHAARFYPSPGGYEPPANFDYWKFHRCGHETYGDKWICIKRGHYFCFMEPVTPGGSRRCEVAVLDNKIPQ